MRARFLTPVLCLLLALAASFPAMAARAATPPGGYYLALGDSLGVGYEAPGIPTDTTCQSASAPGYVCAFYHYLQQITPSLQLENLSEGGANSCVLVHGFGNGSPCADPLVTGTLPSQLDAAVQYLKAHGGEVSPITIDIGGDDFLPLLGEAAIDLPGVVAQVPAVLQTYQVNLDATLSTLRAAAPNAEIIVATQYNPIGGAPAALLPAGLGQAAQQALSSLNGIMEQEAQKYHAIVADVAAAFDANPGGAYLLTFVPTSAASGGLTNVNIHPTADGYALYTQTVIKASGYVVPLTLTAHLAKQRVKHGKKQKVTGTTAAGAAVTITIRLPRRKARTLTLSAASDGTFARSFKVGKNAGDGVVRVCASNTAGQSACTQKMQFIIR